MEPTSELFDSTLNGESPTRGLLGEGKGQDFAEYADRFGRVRVWHFASQVGVLESSGGIGERHAEFIVEYFGKHMDRAPGARFVFGNWLALTAYTAEVRKILTDWQKELRYEGLYVAQTSKLLAMSVSLTNMVLEREIRTFPTLQLLQGEFRSRLEKLQLVGALNRCDSAMRSIQSH